MNQPARVTSTTTTTTVRYVATPSGRERVNPPNLGDLRAFVDACDGLPDAEHVRIEESKLDEGGRRNVTFSVSHRHPEAVEPAPVR